MIRPGRHEHIQKACHIARIGTNGIFDRPGNRAKRGLMQDISHATTSALTYLQVLDIAFNFGEIRPLL
jgi:hypothetical protein